MSDSEDDSAATLQAAQLTWQSDTPYSIEFDDIYFSSAGGLAESRHVFVEANQLPSRWQALENAEPSSFVIAETGFGTGLNFLVAWQCWRECAPKQAQLHYLSVEKYPLNKADLSRALAAQPELANLSRELIDQYPPLVPGVHRLHFPDHNVHLTLMFKDAISAYANLEASVDAWFLDGFAPAKNPQMWQPALFSAMARLSQPGTTFSTFTAAGAVKRGLQEAGFVVQKSPGFGRKRDMLKGSVQLSIPKPDRLTVSEKPWFHPRHAMATNRGLARHAIVIGAGLAGAAAAASLAKRAWQVTVVERAEAPACGASGNPVGMTFTRFGHLASAQNRYYQMAYLHSLRHLPNVMAGSTATEGVDYAFNGVARLAFNANEAQEQQQLMRHALWSADEVVAMSQQGISQRLGVTSASGGIWQQSAGWLNPASLVQAWLSHQSIHCKYSFNVSSMHYSVEQGWSVIDQSGHILQAPVVIIANSLDALNLPFADALPLRRVRGQVTYLPATQKSKNLRHAINYDGYITPARQGIHCVGATFHARMQDECVRNEDHHSNLLALQKALPELADRLHVPYWLNHIDALAGRVGFRCQTPDYLPIIGPLSDPGRFQQDYAGLRTGQLKQSYPLLHSLPGLFVSLAHGSRGITSTTMAAEIVASYLQGEPFPVDEEVRQALHPARFALRALRRRQ